jgi:uncharacterized protein (TIGR02453 family)
MNFRKLYDFLRELQKNNHKDWMDDNRKRYHELRDDFRAFVDDLNRELAKNDAAFLAKPGREAVHRINNNLLFKPDAPTYKNHFSADLNANKHTASYYLHIGLDENIAAGGFYRPDTDMLKRIRSAIDYDGNELKKILEDKKFASTFGELIETDKLKTAPKGYSQDHPHIELLRHKSFAVFHHFTQAEVQASNFREKVIEVFNTMRPFRDYLNKAVSVEG